MQIHELREKRNENCEQHSSDFKLLILPCNTYHVCVHFTLIRKIRSICRLEICVLSLLSQVFKLIKIQCDMRTRKNLLIVRRLQYNE